MVATSTDIGLIHLGHGRPPRARTYGKRAGAPMHTGASRRAQSNAKGRPLRRSRRSAPGHVRTDSYAVAAAASAAWAFSARSTPARDSDIIRRRAALGSADSSQASVASSVSWETWSVG